MIFFSKDSLSMLLARIFNGALISSSSSLVKALCIVEEMVCGSWVADFGEEDACTSEESCNTTALINVFERRREVCGPP